MSKIGQMLSFCHKVEDFWDSHHYWPKLIVGSFFEFCGLLRKHQLLAQHFHERFEGRFLDNILTTFLTFFLFSNIILITRTLKVPLILFLKYDCRKDFTALWPSVYTLLLSSWLQLPAVSNTWNSGKKNMPLTSWHFPPNFHFH